MSNINLVFPLDKDNMLMVGKKMMIVFKPKKIYPIIEEDGTEFDLIVEAEICDITIVDNAS